LKAAFTAASIPCRLLSSAKAKKQLRLNEECVKLMTMHSSKGLEFPTVAVSGVGSMPLESSEPLGEAKLLYVAMTRSTDKLLLTSHRHSEFFEQLQQSTCSAT
ncbi:MAG: ATP-binding domain-containing protein, partial [Gammaproteobacteria bacterium]|nr:ATP-binding domain-containing protein [Gammaproteobacteria bacterium]